MTRRCRLAARPRLEGLDERLLLSTITPARVDSAYGLNAVTFSNGTIKGNGAGQTIAIVDAYHDPSIYGDLAAFDARNGLPNPGLAVGLPANAASATAQPTFTMVNFAGSTTNGGWNEEEGLDVEMAHAAAPGANIVLVEARSAGLYDLISAVNAVKTLPSVTVVSMSWGGSEFDGQQSFDSTFTTPAGHKGITFVASSGDDGAGAQWPASSPNVVGVGGTSLVLNSTGGRALETAWGGSGGGLSQFATKPGYQSQVVSGSSRSVPDVSAVADPSTGVVINSGGSQYQIGGTSLSAPIFASLIAIADQGLAAAGKSTLDGATQTLPDLYKAPSGSFYDVTGGSRASAGYDTSTGLGTPNGVALIQFLDGTATTTKGSGGGGSTTIGKGTTNTTASAVSIPIPTNPNLPASTSPTSTPTAPVPNLVAIPVPNVPTDPIATDAALDSWDHDGAVGFGSLASRSKARG